MLNKRFIGVWGLLLLLALANNGLSQSLSGGETLMNIKGYPTVFELNAGEQYTYERAVNGAVVKHTIKLVKVTPYTSPNFWNLDEEGNGTDRFYSSAVVEVEIDHKPVRIIHRPYELPLTVGGIRIYVEAIKPWALGADLFNLEAMNKDARFSVCLAGESWGPPGIGYYVGNYRFRASSYNNTWGALVPYAPIYYHRGEDRGAIPDRLPVYSVISGKVTGTPLPDGDGASNGLIVKNDDGIVFRIAHMNTENIIPDIQLGSFVKKGELLGYTGSTWLGGKNQTHDPHVHLEMHYTKNDTTILVALFPYLIEAYFRTYPDAVLSIAGGYEWTLPGQAIELDGSRSIARPGKKIKDYKWILHNGDTVDRTRVKVQYDAPGLYTEELLVETTEGDTDRDFLQVRVWSPEKNGKIARNIAWGWIYQYPVRDVKVGDPVLFWNRIHNTVGSVYIDFGDGSAPVKIYNSIAHPFRKPGRYVVKITGKGPQDDPITEKLEVIVNE